LSSSSSQERVVVAAKVCIGGSRDPREKVEKKKTSVALDVGKEFGGVGGRWY